MDTQPSPQPAQEQMPASAPPPVGPAAPPPATIQNGPRRNPTFLIIAAVVAILLLVGIGLLVAHKHSKHAANGPQTVYVTITSRGFSPQSVSVTPGTTVVWVDQDPAPHLPAANPYPSHSSLPSLVAPRALGKGQSYSYRFTKAGTVQYHDDLHPTLNGEVEVK